MSTNDNSHNQQQAAERRERSNVSKAAFKVGAGGIFSLVAGFGSQMLIAALFGAGEIFDAYMTALTIPMYAQGVLLSGVSFVFIPMFVKAVDQGNEDEAWQLVGTFFWIIGGLLLLLSAAIALFAPYVIRATAPGLPADKTALASSMLSVLAFSIVLSGLGTYTTGIQNARNQFFWPAFAGTLNSIASILVMLAFYRTLGEMTLAWSFLVAVGVQATITVVPIVRHGWKGTLAWNDPRVTIVFKLVAPFIMLGLVTRVAPVIQRFFASGLADGELSYLGYSAKTARVFQGLLGATIVTAIFPALSRRFARDGKHGLLAGFRYGMRLTMAVALPTVIIASVLAVPLITVLYQRGAFDAQATLDVARVMPIQLIRSILFIMVGNLLTRIFYVTEDTRTVPLITASTILLYIPLASWGARTWGYMGLATAELIYALAGICVLLGLLIHRFGRQALPPRQTVSYLGRYVSASAVAGLVAWLCMSLLATHGAFSQLMIGGLASGLVYLALLWQLDSAITRNVLEMGGVHVLAKMPGMQNLSQKLDAYLGKATIR